MIIQYQWLLVCLQEDLQIIRSDNNDHRYVYVDTSVMSRGGERADSCCVSMC